MKFHSGDLCSARPLSIYASKRRPFSTSLLASIATPPAVFAGLLLTLWVYKCVMMVVFQNKIIYMPSMPPYSRSEKIEDYAQACAPIEWREERIRSTDGTNLSLCVASSPKSDRNIVLLYFQGNGSSLPPRLPMLSTVLRSAGESCACTIIALSYRGYWNSSGRASQPGIEKDAAAALTWAHQFRTAQGQGTKLILWGQSIGAGVATKAAADSMETIDPPSIDALVLETPFTSIRDMLISLYPQKWLPYRYLGPFLRNWWDSEAALDTIKRQKVTPKLLILNAEKDEVVPGELGRRLVAHATATGLDVQHLTIRGALHHEVMLRSSGRTALQAFLERIARV